MKIKKFISLLLVAMLTVTSNFNCSAMISDSDPKLSTGSPSNIVIPKRIPRNEHSVEEIKQIARDFEQFPEKLKVSDDIIASVDAACDSYDAKLDRTRAELKKYRDGTKPTSPCPVLKDKRFYEGATAGGILVAAIATIGISVYRRVTHTRSNHK